MLSSRAGESMIASAKVLPYDYAMLGDGLVPIELAANVVVPTLVLAAEEQPSTARALVDVLPHAELLLAPASTHRTALLSGVPTKTLTAITGLTRQRLYQIRDRRR